MKYKDLVSICGDELVALAIIKQANKLAPQIEDMDVDDFIQVAAIKCWSILKLRPDYPPPKLRRAALNSMINCVTAAKTAKRSPLGGKISLTDYEKWEDRD